MRKTLAVLALSGAFILGSCANPLSTGGSAGENPSASASRAVASSSMRGINHAHAWYTDRLDASLSGIRQWGATSVRVVLSNGHRYPKTPASQVSAILSKAKALGFTSVVLEVHDTTGYGEDGSACSLASAVAYWKELKTVLSGQEGFAVINIGNEPYGNSGYGNWTADTVSAVKALRTAGFRHTLMADAPNWGQDWSNTMRDNAPTVLAADSLRNVVFSVHMYGVYNSESKIRSYMKSFDDRGLSLVIGEFGNYHSDGDVDEVSVLSCAKEYGFGYFAWSWCGNGGGVEYLDLVNSWDSSKPTSWGSWFRSAGLSGSSVPPGGSGGTSTLFGFEGSTQGWTGSGVSAGPWTVTEWKAEGASSLKADAALSSGKQLYLAVPGSRSLSGKTKLKAVVRRASWGNWAGGFAKLYVKTGSSWSWYDGGAVSIGSDSAGYTLSLSLSSVANLGDVREIGVQFVAGSGASGTSAVYVDAVTVE